MVDSGKTKHTSVEWFSMVDTGKTKHTDVEWFSMLDTGKTKHTSVEWFSMLDTGLSSLGHVHGNSCHKSTSTKDIGYNS